MTDTSKTNQELIAENTLLKQRIRELEHSESGLRRAEEALENERTLLRTLIDNVPDRIYAKDGEGRFIICNEAAARRMGMTRPAELIGKSDFDFLPHEMAKRFRADERAIFQSGIPMINREEPLATEDGKITRWNLATKVPLTDKQGNRIGIVGIGREITDLKQAEEELQKTNQKLQAIIDASPLAIFTLDRNLKVTNWSPSAERMFGWSSEEVIGQFNPIVPEEKKEEFKALVAKVLAGIGYSGSEVWRQTKDGRSVFVNVSAAPLWDAHRKVVGALSVVQDITDRRRADEEKRGLEERLQRAEKMEALGTLAGGVAHDLNNVLGIVIGYAELLLHSVDPSSPIRKGLQNIMDGGQRSATIVQDLLTLARRGVPGQKVLNLNQLIRELQQSQNFANLSSLHSSIRIQLDLDPGLMSISGSSVHLGKTLFNLVLNAIEAMPNGGTVTIHTVNQYLDKPIQGYDQVREGEYVVLSVSDTGEGISAADQKHIFEPFYTKKVMGRSGTGLGLAVVWGTVKDHHGYINVQSDVGKGSIFTLYFPVSREEMAIERIAVPASEYMGRGESILIVDDVKGQRDLASDMLQNLNYRVASVSSGEEAVAYLTEHTADLIVLDMIMDPGMDGLDTYRSILEIHPRQKAIIVSGFSETYRVNAAQALGAGSYVRKPYVLEKLGVAVRKELDRIHEPVH